MIGLLKEEGIKFGYFDILTNDEVRQGAVPKLITYSTHTHTHQA